MRAAKSLTRLSMHSCIFSSENLLISNAITKSLEPAPFSYSTRLPLFFIKET